MAPSMADGFAAVDYVTNLRLSEVGGKRLWLVRVPRHIQTTRLEVRMLGAKDVRRSTALLYRTLCAVVPVWCLYIEDCDLC